MRTAVSARTVVFAVACVLTLGPLTSWAQEASATFDLRLDGLAGGHDTPVAVHVGIAVVRRLGTYARFGAAAGAGPSEDGFSGRTEGFVRFHLDPLRERRWGLYGVGGAGMLWTDGSDPFLLFTLGVEGRQRGAWAPAVELGFSRGVRVALVLRRGGAARR